jgi:peptide chain release factor 2
MQKLSAFRDEVTLWRGMERQVTDLLGLSELVGDDEGMQQELASEIATLEQQMEAQQSAMMFSGEYDARDALLSVHAGAGGTESQDWAAILLRMYLRWAETRGFKTEVLETTEGEEAGIKSVTVQISGKYAFGNLRSERGVHRLVRLSPFDAAHRRHTSFALVEVLPDIGEDIEIDIKADDLKIDVFRSSSAGGQNVQKNSTAVRITHLPSGIVVACQNERSQLQNKLTAMRVLKARLFDIELRRREEEQARLKGQRVDMGWGNQIRSYVLHPYHMVKDHRTEHEVGNTTAVLDGDIDGFIGAYLRA